MACWESVVTTKRAFAQAAQIVFAHQSPYPLAVHRPATPLWLGGNPAPSVGWPLEGDLLHLVPEFGDSWLRGFPATNR
jgi:hypothetical protein